MSMKRYFLLLCVALLPFVSFAQEAVQAGRVNQEGLMIGKHTWHDEGGVLIAEIIYDDHGTALSYKTWENGDIMEAEELPSDLEKGVFPAHMELEHTSTGLGYMRTQSGSSPVHPQEGQKAILHYEGYLQDHSIFDSSYKRGKPFRFNVGKSEVIPGFEEAVKMMQPGEIMYVYVPHQLGYGGLGLAKIPPYSNIWYKIELLEIK